MRISLLVSLAALSVSTGAFGAGVFGMNLLSGHETNPELFHQVTGSLIGGSVGLFALIYTYYSKTKQPLSTCSRLSVSVTQMRSDHKSHRLFAHSDRSKLLYNYQSSAIEDKEQYERFLRSNQADSLSNFRSPL
jgi:hypothetical protein